MKSVVSYPERGTGGDRKYRGNCSPKLIEDIITQYKLKGLNDYMVGSGTTEDVVKKMGLQGDFYDLNRGYDMLSMDIPQRAQNIFWHPPYDNIIIYSGEQYSAENVMREYGFDPRINDLSRCKDWDEFVKKMNYCCMKQFTSLEKGGRMFILVGDIKKKGKMFSMLNDIVKPGILEQIIIKMQYNCVSDSRTYKGSFVPIVHEYLLVLKKESAVVIPVKWSRDYTYDVRDSQKVTWRDVLASIMQDYGEMPLSRIYSILEGHQKCQGNPHWHEKVRQVLRAYPDMFKCTKKGCYAYQKSQRGESYVY